jgi:hypothetical protein
MDERYSPVVCHMTIHIIIVKVAKVVQKIMMAFGIVVATAATDATKTLQRRFLKHRQLTPIFSARSGLVSQWRASTDTRRWHVHV